MGLIPVQWTAGWLDGYLRLYNINLFWASQNKGAKIPRAALPHSFIPQKGSQLAGHPLYREYLMH